ncbi:hypothetical protein V8G54_011783 [Vigna mungo]|uniref:Uncharacterized protein n=1 Tax=Vigna mungo TaxID=3915 RepID=A0AAQ3NS85_VIGMU
MARKKLLKAGEGTSSSATATGSANVTLTTLSKVTEDVKVAQPKAIRTKPKRKAAEKTPSPPKRQKTKGPLLTGPLDPQAHVSDLLQYNLTPEERAPFKGMTPSESYNMAYELMARASVCMNYAAGTTKPLLVTELETATDKVNELTKSNAALTARIEELTKAVEGARIKSKTALEASRKEVVSLQSSIDTLQADLRTANSLNDELLRDKEAIITEQDDLLKDKSTWEDEVCRVRELGFQQGIGQCHYFFNTLLEHPQFDIMKIYMDGALVDLVDSSSLAIEAPSPAQPTVVTDAAKDPPLVQPTAETDVANQF